MVKKTDIKEKAAEISLRLIEHYGRYEDATAARSTC